MCGYMILNGSIARPYTAPLASVSVPIPARPALHACQHTLLLACKAAAVLHRAFRSGAGRQACWRLGQLAPQDPRRQHGQGGPG